MTKFGKIPISQSGLGQIATTFLEAVHGRAKAPLAKVTDESLLQFSSLNDLKSRKVIRDSLLAADESILGKLFDFRTSYNNMGKKSLTQLDEFILDILRERWRCIDDRLEMQRLSLEHLSSNLVNYLIGCERVHPINGREELKSRLIGNRVGYGLFHPAIGEYPLVMLYVALCHHQFPTFIKEIISTASPKQSGDETLAVFYSISLCNQGAKGLGMGRKLLLLALKDLSIHYPSIKSYSTLSPIIKFRAWLARMHPGCPEGLLVDECERFLKECFNGSCEIMDPVAVFHYGNGAVLDKILLRADDPRRYPGTSFGIMASYLYEPSKLEERANEFTRRISKGGSSLKSV